MNLVSRLNFRQNWPLLGAGGLLLIGTVYHFVSIHSLDFIHGNFYWIYPVLIFTQATSGYFLILTFAAYLVLPSHFAKKPGSLKLYYFLLLLMLTIGILHYLQTNFPVYVITVIPAALLLALIVAFFTRRTNLKLSPPRPWLQIIGVLIPLNLLTLASAALFEFSSFEHRGTEIFDGSWYQLAVNEHHYLCSQQEVEVYQCSALGILCKKVFISEQYGCLDEGFADDLPATIALINDHEANKLFLQLGDEKILIAQ